MGRYQIYNGKLIDEGQNVLSSDNRGFNFGDGFFESIRIFNGRAPFLPLHWKRMQFAANILGLNLDTNLDYQSFKRQVLELALKNEEPNSRVRFQCFRLGAGKYAPENNEVGWVLVSKKLATGFFELNKTGLKVGVFSRVRVNPAPQSSFKSISCTPYILGSNYAKMHQLDDCLMLDFTGSLAESTNSNIFLVIGNTLITPTLENGGVNGVMRNVVLETASKLGYTCKYSALSLKQMLNADELFLTNATSGLRWVAGFEKKRYFKRASQKIVAAINEQYQFS